MRLITSRSNKICNY